MIRSMTGFGAAQKSLPGVEVAVEAKSVNGRFLKLSSRLPPGLAAFEAGLEALVRTHVRRGTISLRVDLRYDSPDALVRVDEAVVRAYQTVFRRLGLNETPLSTLPGVLSGTDQAAAPEVLAAAHETVTEALKQLSAMRAREGVTLAQVLCALCDELETIVTSLRERVPAVVEEYRRKLHQRLASMIEGFGTELDQQLLAREAAMFADRSDITEEIERLQSHVSQVRELVNGNDEAGRTLEFLSQELVREANTMGSKSADVELSRRVVRLKTVIERFKEQIANVE